MEDDEFPFDLMEDIFCRLPVKSLLRFKVGCRRWLLLIKDPKFIKLHLQRSTQSHSTHGSLVTVVQGNQRNQLGSLDFSTLHVTKESDIPFSESPIDSIRLVGACNGLICLSTWDNNTIMLWNMSTKEHKILPPAPVPWHCPFWLILFGFGYDPCNDDYKVVRVYENCSTRNHRAIFYSLRLNSWRCNYKHVFPDGQILFPRAGVYAGGALNWMAQHTTHNDYHYGQCSMHFYTIIGLDLNTENARDLHFPYKPNDPLFRISSVSVFEGKLCVVGTKDKDWYGQKQVIDIWVMEEYGKEESWTKLFSIPPPYANCWVFKPLTYYHCGKNGDQVLLLLHSGELFNYNFKEDKFSNRGCIPHLPHLECFHKAHICHASLVPINQDLGASIHV